MKLELLPEGLDGALIHVEEECAEVIQEVIKIRRFGLDSYHPREIIEGSNRTRLFKEMSQLKEAIDRCVVELCK